MAVKPDEELVSAALRGDVDSFMMLCDRYYPAMVAIAHAILGDHHLAEDAAQEAFAEACRSLDSLKNRTRFAAWLAAICRNEARDLVRRTPKTESLGDRDVAEETPEESPEVEVVRQAMDRLTPASRELLWLRYRSELSYQGISDLLGISPQAVHGRLRRAKQAVQEYLARQRHRRLL